MAKQKFAIKTCVSCGRDVKTTAASKAPLCGECRGGSIVRINRHDTGDVEELHYLGLKFSDPEFADQREASDD